jgi:hypothetical protein
MSAASTNSFSVEGNIQINFGTEQTPNPFTLTSTDIAATPVKFSSTGEIVITLEELNNLITQLGIPSITFGGLAGTTSLNVNNLSITSNGNFNADVKVKFSGESGPGSGWYPFGQGIFGINHLGFSVQYAKEAEALSITPTTAKTGGTVTVKGLNLEGATKVMFNSSTPVDGTIGNNTAKELIVTIPAATDSFVAGTPVTVTVDTPQGNTTSTQEFTLEASS